MIRKEDNIAFVKLEGPDGYVRFPVDNVSMYIDTETIFNPKTGEPADFKENYAEYKFKVDTPVHDIYYEISSE